MMLHRKSPLKRLRCVRAASKQDTLIWVIFQNTFCTENDTDMRAYTISYKNMPKIHVTCYDMMEECSKYFEVYEGFDFGLYRQPSPGFQGPQEEKAIVFNSVLLPTAVHFHTRSITITNSFIFRRCWYYFYDPYLALCIPQRHVLQHNVAFSALFPKLAWQRFEGLFFHVFREIISPLMSGSIMQ